MEYFIEGVLELLFGMAKDQPDTMPEIEYKDNFIIQYNKSASFIILLLIFTGSITFFILSLFMNGDTKILFIIFCILLCVLFLLYGFLFSCKYNITSKKIEKMFLFLLKKEILWQNIICAKIIEETDERNVIIALYGKDGKCVVDVSTEMENSWYIIKMAEQKNIEIRNEKDLSLKQISKL